MKVVDFSAGVWLTVLALIFMTLKLTGYITWSWWWVLSPILIPWALLLLILLGMGLLELCDVLHSYYMDYKK